MKLRHHSRADKIYLQMTPMIDIVFQLLIFFIFTLKIVSPEGDFNIKMPVAAANVSAAPTETPTLRLRLQANDEGQLTALKLGDTVFSGENRFRDLHLAIRDLVSDAGGPGSASDQEVEIDADYDLHYGNVIRAITAISGYIEGGQRHSLVEKVRFTPPKAE